MYTILIAVSWWRFFVSQKHILRYNRYVTSHMKQAVNCCAEDYRMAHDGMLQPWTYTATTRQATPVEDIYLYGYGHRITRRQCKLPGQIHVCLTLHNTYRIIQYRIHRHGRLTRQTVQGSAWPPGTIPRLAHSRIIVGAYSQSLWLSPSGILGKASGTKTEG